MNNRSYMTVFTASTPVNKQVAFEDGKLTKSMANAPAVMTAETRHVPDSDALHAVLQEVGSGPYKCISLGFVPGTEDGAPFEIVSRKRLSQMLKLSDDDDPPSGVIEISGKCFCTRTKSNFQQGSWILFDKDSSPGQPESLITDNTEEWLSWMAELVPGFASAEKVIVPSTSSRVMLNGSPAFAGGGLHCYVRTQDTEDLPRFKQELIITAMSTRFGFMKPSISKATGETVSQQPWTIIDVSVFSPERLVFDGAPLVMSEELTVAPLDIEVANTGCGPLDTGQLRTTEADMEKVAKASGLKVKRDTVAGVRVPVLVDDQTLQLDTLLDTERGGMSVEQYCLSEHKHLRCQAVFRPDSTSQAAFVNRHQDGTPLLYDSGSGIKYVLARSELTKYVQLRVNALHELSEEAEIEAVLTLLKLVSPVVRERFLKQMKTALACGIGVLREQFKEISLQKNKHGSVVDYGEKAARLTLQAHYADGDHLTIGPGGEFFEYTGTHWRRIQKDRVSNRALTSICDHSLNDGGVPVSMLVANVVSLLRAMQCVEDDPFSLTGEVLPIINTLNGELWIDQNGEVELRPHKPTDYQLSVLPCEYDPDAKAPMFEHAIGEIFSRNKQPEEMVRHIMEIIGYIVQPTRHIASVFIWEGGGNDGKSTVKGVVEDLLGINAVYSAEIAKMKTDTNDLGPMAGKQLFVDDDLDTGTALPDGLMKKLSESKIISGSYKHGQVFNFNNRTVPLLLCNNPPHLKDLSKGVRRRLQVVPFKRSFTVEEADVNLPTRIKNEEMSGVLNLAIAGAQRVLQRGHFDPPAECEEALDELLIAANPLPAFLSEWGGDWYGVYQTMQDAGYAYLLPNGEAWITLSKLLKAFNQWAAEFASGYKLSTQNLRKNMIGLGHTVVKKNNQLVWLQPEGTVLVDRVAHHKRRRSTFPASGAAPAYDALIVLYVIGMGESCNIQRAYGR
ncbi:MAG: hypothetical protein HOE44_15005 [Candidatus Marinimicrobia bacterium]|nr:hypothetical protein [Candidatus Neomarinimicrobiota bacterium]